MNNETNQETGPQTTQMDPGRVENPAGYLAQEYEQVQALFESQPVLTQHAFHLQARVLADAVELSLPRVRFAFPDTVVAADPVTGKAGTRVQIPAEQREQMVGGLMERLTHTSLATRLRQHLDELEASDETGIASAARLLRYATAAFMVDDLLPSGRTVTYATAEGEDIPTLPVATDEVRSALTEATDAIAEEAQLSQEEERGELQVPYVPAARRFYLPQWVAFDEQDHLLVSSVNVAEAHILSMQRYLKILHAAVALAPYMLASPHYQQKRYGMLGQLINQGRALARYQTRQIIATIRRRAAANDLNRGLSLSLPYFNDQELELKTLDFDVIPGGRIMFLPSFVVLASRKEQAKAAQDTRLSPSTRAHLLVELQMLETAFFSGRESTLPTSSR